MINSISKIQSFFNNKEYTKGILFIKNLPNNYLNDKEIQFWYKKLNYYRFLNKINYNQLSNNTVLFGRFTLFVILSLVFFYSKSSYHSTFQV